MIVDQPSATFVLLNGRLGWRLAAHEGLSVGATTSGIRLAADPKGPLALTYADDSLGGLVLPRGMAVDSAGRLFLLELDAPWHIKTFDTERVEFRELPSLGGAGNTPRRFDRPSNIAIAGRNLYVADSGNRRVQVFALGSLALRYVWGPLGSDGCPVPDDDAPAWQPVDLASRGSTVYVLDARWSIIYRHDAGSDELTPYIDTASLGRTFSRIAVDRDGRVYVLDAAASSLAAFDSNGSFVGWESDSGDIRDRFPPPLVRLFQQSPAGGQFFFRLPSTPDGALFDRNGRPASLDPADIVPASQFLRDGRCVTQALDSGIYGCQWHRLELEHGVLPPGSSIAVSTYAAADTGDPPGLDSPLWEVGYTAAGAMQPPPSAGADLDDEQDALVRSDKGQFLWLKIELRGDGHHSPILSSLRVHYPRLSYLRYLPAVYSTDDDSRRFLEHFLSIFQFDWERIEHQVDNVLALFDPKAVPAGGFLETLASILDLPLEQTWTEEQKRRLLLVVPRIYRQRGTSAALQIYLQAYLENIACVTAEEQRDYPQIVEAFRERRRLMLSDRSSQPAPLWGPGAVGRLQLGVYSRAGEARLVSTGDPRRDLFHEYGNRFSLFIPAAWVSTIDDERMLRRAVEAEKPAHAAYELCLVESRFRVGVQSTVGLDTIIGGVPVARLTCDTMESKVAPSRGLRHRLNYDTVLACSAPSPLQVGRGQRIGASSILR